MLNRLTFSFALALTLALSLLGARAGAEPSPRPSASTDDLRVRGEHRRLPPEMLERIRNRVRTPSGAGRLVRQRERAFDEAVKDPDGKGADIAARMQELREHAADLRRERRRLSHARWGEATLTPQGKEELALHGRTMAKIRRLQYLAVTERTGEKRSALLERLARLKDLERGRHERAMQAVAARQDAKPSPSGASKAGAP